MQFPYVKCLAIATNCSFGKPSFPQICQSSFRRISTRTPPTSLLFCRLQLTVCHSSADRGGAPAAVMANGGPPRLLIVSDLDSTMVDHEDIQNTSLLRFGSLWEAAYRHDSMLVFSTGRSPIMYQKLRTEVPLLTPDITITSVGTEIVYGDTMEADTGWTEELNQGWDRNAVLEEVNKLSLKFQDESEQRPHKLSFKVEKAKAVQIVEDLSEKLKARGVNAKLIYSGGQDLDVLPQGAGKGQALAYLIKKFKAEKRAPLNTLVCGDSGNDADLFAVPDVHGVMVENAMEELVQWHEKHAKDNARIFRATERCAAGIIQAMQHFSFIPNIPPRDLSSQQLLQKDTQPEDGISRVAAEVVEYQLYLEKWIRGEVDNSDASFGRLDYTMDENSSIIFAHGAEANARRTVDNARHYHGTLPHFRSWVDRVRIRKVAEGAWSVIFHKWQKASPGYWNLNDNSGRTGRRLYCKPWSKNAQVAHRSLVTAEELNCKISSGLLVLQEGTPNGLKWLLIHETWLAGHEGKPMG